MMSSRQRFVDMIAEQVKVLGMVLPDPKHGMTNENTMILVKSTGQSFWQVVKGYGPATNKG